jgi:cytidine deaminase
MILPSLLSAVCLSYSTPFVIPAETVNTLTEQISITREELLQQLVPFAQSLARPLISNYRVGVALLGKSGAIYLGVNLEFPGMPLNQTIHAEQFGVACARQHGETSLIAMAGSAAPCGHCRQFLNEVDDEGTLQIYVANTEGRTLPSLLPAAFGPKNLGLQDKFMIPLSLPSHPASLEERARIAALSSHAPYTLAKSGVALETEDGKVYTGSYLENAAFNPSLSPLHTALIALVADGQSYTSIQRAVLCEQRGAKISHEAVSCELLKQIAPGASFAKTMAIPEGTR